MSIGRFIIIIIATRHTSIFIPFDQFIKYVNNPANSKNTYSLYMILRERHGEGINDKCPIYYVENMLINTLNK